MDWENMYMHSIANQLGDPNYIINRIYIYIYTYNIDMGLQIDSESNGLVAIHGHGLVCLYSRKCRSNCLVQET